MSSWKFLSENLPPALLRTELPTIVRERCDNAQQQAVWLAIRWLLASDKKKPIANRELSERAKVDVKTITPTVERLVEKRLVEIVGFEQTGNFPAPSPIYQIPTWIEKENAHFTERFLITYRNPRPAPISESQLRLELHDPKTDHGHDPKTDHPDPKTDHGHDPKTDHRTLKNRGEEEEEGGGGSRSLSREIFQPGKTTPLKPPEEKEGIEQHPHAIWVEERENATPSDYRRLNSLISKHDKAKGAYTGGYGEFWVARAIVEASFDPEFRANPKGLNHVSGILKRWRRDTTPDRNAYGTDLDMETTHTATQTKPRKELSHDHRTPTPQRVSPDRRKLRLEPGDDGCDIIGMPADTRESGAVP